MEVVGLVRFVITGIGLVVRIRFRDGGNREIRSEDMDVSLSI